MAFLNIAKKCAPLFLGASVLGGCVTTSGPGGCEAYDIAADCYSAREFSAFMTYGDINISNIGNGALDKPLIVESALRNMSDQQVTEDFRPGLIAQTPNGEAVFKLAGRILDARENGTELRLRRADLEILGIAGQTVLVIQPDDLDTFIQDNQEAIDNLSGAREPLRAPAASFE